MKFKGFLLIFLTLLASLYSAADSAVKYVAYTYPTVSLGVATSETLTVVPTPTPLLPTEAPNLPEEKKEVAVPVAAVGEAKGKIISEFLSPYNAGNNYGKVYLKNSTGVNIDIKGLLESKCAFNLTKTSEPQVLIVHTHTTESYISHDSDYYTDNDNPRTTDETKNLVVIGNIFEEKLKKAGIGVVHDTTVHDYPSYTGSYSRSAKTISSDLNTYKSIKVVIDIHRDSITRDSDKIKPIAKISGKEAAQVMLVMGSQTGSVTNHEKWQENLKFALKYQEKMEEKFPGLARALMLNSSKYNQNLSVGSILLEVGSEANTFKEAKLGAELAADALIELLGELTE